MSKHTKSDRQLLVQHVLSLVGRSLTNNEIISCLNDVYSDITAQTKIKGDLLGLRRNISSNVEMVENEGNFTHQYVGSQEYLPPLKNKSFLNMDMIEKLKNEESSINGNNEKEAKEDNIIKEPKKGDTSLEIESDQAVRNTIAKFLLERKTKSTIDKIVTLTGEDEELVRDELSLMVEENFAQSTYVKAFNENVYGSTETTEECIKEITEDTTKNKSLERAENTESISEVSEENNVSVEPISEKIKESILSLLYKDAVNGGKGKQAIANMIFKVIKGFGIAKHDIEDLISEFIKDGKLVEHGKVGRGSSYISAKYVNENKSDKDEAKEPEKSASKEKTKEIKEDLSSKGEKEIVGDFSISKLISNLESSIKEDNKDISSETTEILHILAKRVENIEAENKKWRNIMSSLITDIKAQFN